MRRVVASAISNPMLRMLDRLILYIVDVILFIWLSLWVQIGVAATAVLIVTVTVLKPAAPVQGIAVNPLALDMTGQTVAR